MCWSSTMATTSSTNKRRKKQKKIENVDLGCAAPASSSTDDQRRRRPWPDIPDLVLDIVSKKLTIADYTMFSGVCRQWRLFSTVAKKDFLASHPPLLLLPKQDASPLCHFYSLPDRRHFTRCLPHVSGRNRLFLSFCSGHLITVDNHRRGPAIVNPITGAAVRLPPSPVPILFAYLHWPPTSPNWTLVAFSRDDRHILTFRPSHSKWSVQTNRCTVADIALFEGKMYALHGDNCDLVALSIGRWVNFQFLKVEQPPWPGDYGLVFECFLFKSGDELLLVRLFTTLPHYEEDRLDVHKLVHGDGPGLADWAKVSNLGDKALFICGGRRSYMTLSSPKWGFRANCVYLIRPRNNKWIVCCLDHRTKFDDASHLFNGVVHKTGSPVWVFPHMC